MTVAISLSGAIDGVAALLSRSTSSLNLIMQYAESYMLKGADIQNKVKIGEQVTVASFVKGLRDAGLDSRDARKVVVKWLEQDALKKVHAMQSCERVAEMASNSVRVMVGSDSVLNALRELLRARTVPPAQGEA